MRPGPAVQVLSAGDDLPDPAEVRAVYAAASTPPPLCEPPAVAGLFADVYAASRTQPGLTVVTARRDGVLVGIAYGHAWRWSEQTYPWAEQLRAALGPAAGRLDPSFAVPLLAVDPDEGGRGLGRRLLTALLDRAAHPTAWLQTTDADTPALRLYRSAGWRDLGHGPDAPDGRPGLVLVHP